MSHAVFGQAPMKSEKNQNMSLKGAHAKEIQHAIEEEKETLKKENIEYWSRFISELKTMRQQQKK